MFMSWCIYYESGFEAHYSGDYDGCVEYADSMVYRFGNYKIEEYEG